MRGSNKAQNLVYSAPTSDNSLPGERYGELKFTSPLAASADCVQLDPAAE